MNGEEVHDGPTHEETAEVLRVDDLRVWFPVLSSTLRRRVGWKKAVDGVSLSIGRGETLALVGESGSGKSTTGRSIVRVQKVTSGRISLLGEDITDLRGRALRERRRHLQMIFQDPTGSLNPRRSVAQVLDESLHAQGLSDTTVLKRRQQLLEQVGLAEYYGSKLPHQLSGGQRQRVGVARALSTEPSLVVCDEPVSSLDVSIQAQILTMLARLQADLGVAYLFISHDLTVVRTLASSVAVLYSGRLVEIGPVESLFTRPRHPYTAALIAAVPRGNPDLPASERIYLRADSSPEGSPDGQDQGCSFRCRCWAYELLGRPEVCRQVGPPPALQPAPGEQPSASCHFPDEVADLAATELPLLQHPSTSNLHPEEVE